MFMWLATLARPDVRNWKTETIEFKKMPSGRERQYSSPVKGILAEGDSIVWAALYDGLGKYNIKEHKR
jgi:hypothetical protein